MTDTEEEFKYFLHQSFQDLIDQRQSELYEIAEGKAEQLFNFLQSQGFIIQKWRPISEAPKDKGKLLLLIENVYRGIQHTETCIWDEGRKRWVIENDQEEVADPNGYMIVSYSFLPPVPKEGE